VKLSFCLFDPTNIKGRESPNSGLSWSDLISCYPRFKHKTEIREPFCKHGDESEIYVPMVRIGFDPIGLADKAFHIMINKFHQGPKPKVFQFSLHESIYENFLPVDINFLIQYITKMVKVFDFPIEYAEITREYSDDVSDIQSSMFTKEMRNLEDFENLYPISNVSYHHINNSKYTGIVDKLERPYVEFGCGEVYSVDPKLRKNQFYIDTAISESNPLKIHAGLVKSTIQDFFTVLNQLPLQDRCVDTIYSCRTLEHFSLSGLFDLREYLTKVISYREIRFVVPDYVQVMKELRKKDLPFGSSKHHIINSEIFGFDDWETKSDHRCAWSKSLLKEYLLNIYMQTYPRTQYKIDFRKVEIDGKKWYIEGRLVNVREDQS